MRARLRRCRSYGTELTLAFDRELIPNRVVAAFNLIYQPEWTRVIATGLAEQESTAQAAVGLMAQMRPGFLSAAKCATCGDTMVSVWTNSQARRCLSVQPPISNCRRAPADCGLEHSGLGAAVG